MTQEEINRIIVEKGEGGCWHVWDVNTFIHGSCHPCMHCRAIAGKIHFSDPLPENPDFALWENFGRLLEAARLKLNHIEFNDLIHRLKYELAMCYLLAGQNPITIDQIPSLVSAELARVLEEKK